MARFTGGGSLDGAALDLPPCVTSVTTTGGNYYEFDAAGTFAFTGAGRTGAIMSGIIRRDRQADAAERAAIEAAAAPRGCGRCGRTLIGSAAWTVHFESGEGSRCLPGDACGQLEERDGVWVLAGPGR